MFVEIVLQQKVFKFTDHQVWICLITVVSSRWHTSVHYPPDGDTNTMTLC